MNFRKYIFIGIILLAFILRFYQLGEVPTGLYQDETAIGYNAYSILKTGKDEYGKNSPLYFKSFGDWKHPIYIYATVFSEAVFGITAFAVRFPSAFCGFLSVIILYFFVKQLTKNENLSLVSSFLFAVNPWTLHYNRATFEVSVALFLYLFGGLLFLYSIEKKKFVLFILGVILFLINLYTYNLTRLLSPLLLVIFLFYKKDDIAKIPKEWKTVTVISSFLLILPFIFTFFSGGGVNSASGTLITTSASIKAPLLEFKSYLATYPVWFSKLFFSIDVSIVWKYLNNIASYFSAQFFFISGSNHGNHGIGNVGQFYLIEFLFIPWGIIHLIKVKAKWIKLLISWAVLVVLVAALTRETPHATRSFFLVIPLAIFSAAGILSIWNYLLNLKLLGKISIVVISLIFTYNLIYYFTSYYVRFPIAYAKAWREEDKNLSEFIKNNQSSYEKIIFDKKSGFIYSSLLFYNKYDPKNFQTASVRASDDSEGFSEIKSFGKYEFKDIDWTKDLKKGVLIVTNQENKPREINTLATFDFPQRPVVISDKEKIFEYPVTDNAYVVVESN